MHRLLKRQIKHTYGKEFNISDLDEKTLLLMASITETYQNFDEEKAFLNQTVKENKKAIQEAYKSLLTSSRLAVIGEMMENITHQWKQPLSIILNLVTLLKLEIKDNKEIEIIEEQTQYLNKTIVDFTNFSSHSDTEKKSFKINKSIDETIHIFNFQATAHKITIHQDLEEDLTVEGDIGQFNQALLVIFSNAKDAFISKETTKRLISIKSESVDNTTVIKIRDNAGGIPENVIDRIFEPYFTTKFKDKGTGIGLSMTYNIINKMSGNIEVNNCENGAEFTIVIPSKFLREDKHG
ncbi:MAG: Unknown protein [uncultured Sulfurovum sp.]|uniref:histidine kinase n=1 Tax=uncultured Sulfurovum sp. TaxID=269237 RepID=A0A6S6T3I8_9BACT|nr:MAG: Unknown protein [uncultured Sulfurovum sp.]